MSDGKTNKFDVLYSRETVHGLGEYSASLAVEHSYGNIWAVKSLDIKPGIQLHPESYTIWVHEVSVT